MKYSFQLQDGREAVVKFKHTGKRKGKSPKGTICWIVVGEDRLAQAWAKPAEFIAVIDGEPTKAGAFPTGKLVRKVTTVNGRKISIYKGDQFSKKEGRSESFFKAIQILSSEDQRLAALAMIEQGAVRP